MSLSRRAARNFAGQTAMLCVSFADRIVFTAILIRAWGTDLFSDWATILAACNLLMIAEFGFQVMLGNSLVRAEGRRAARAFNRLVAVGLYFYLVLGAILLGTVATMAAVGDIGRMLSLLEMPRANLVFLLLALYSILRIMRSGVTQVFRGRGEVHQLTWTEVRALTAVMVCACAAVLLGASPVAVAALYLGVEILAGEAIALAIVLRRFPDVRLWPARPSRSEVRDTTRNLPWYGWLMGANSAMLHLPVLIIAWLGLGGAPLAALVLQRTLVNFGKTMSSAVSLAIGIEIADVGPRSPQNERIEAVRMLGRFNVALAALLAAGLLVFGDPIVAVWTGSPDLGSRWILIWLLLPIVLTGPAIPLQMLTFYGGQPRPQAIASAVQIGTGLPLALIGGLHAGVIGVAFGIGVGEVVGLAVVLPALAASSTRIRYLPILRECMVFFLAALVWAGICGLGVTRLVPPGDLVSLGAALAAWALVAGPPIAWFGLPRSVRMRLRGLLTSRLDPRTRRGT